MTTAAPLGDDFSDVSGVVLAHLLGATLAQLTAVPDTTEGDAHLVDVATALARLEAWVVGQRSRVVALLLERTRAELRRYGTIARADGRPATSAASHGFDDDRMAHRMVSTDVALATGGTPWAADWELDLAEGLAAHPELARALSLGRVDRRRAEIILTETAQLDRRSAREGVVAAIVGDGSAAAEHPDRRTGMIRELHRSGTHLWHLPPAVIRRAVRRECAAIDPDLAAVRESTARDNRRVTARSLPTRWASCASRHRPAR